MAPASSRGCSGPLLWPFSFRPLRLRHDQPVAWLQFASSSAIAPQLAEPAPDTPSGGLARPSGPLPHRSRDPHRPPGLQGDSGCQFRSRRGPGTVPAADGSGLSVGSARSRPRGHRACRPPPCLYRSETSGVTSRCRRASSNFCAGALAWSRECLWGLGLHHPGAAQALGLQRAHAGTRQAPANWPRALAGPAVGPDSTNFADLTPNHHTA